MIYDLEDFREDPWEVRDILGKEYENFRKELKVFKSKYKCNSFSNGNFIIVSSLLECSTPMHMVVEEDLLDFFKRFKVVMKDRFLFTVYNNLNKLALIRQSDFTPKNQEEEYILKQLNYYLFRKAIL